MRAPSSRKRYLSVWLRRLMTDRLIRGRSPAPAEPAHVGGSRFAQNEALVVAEPVKGALRLAAVNDAAARLGLNTGMALADARAMYPRIAIADADPNADRRMLIAIADWCDRYTPLVGLDPPDGLLLDITGCAHLFGGEETLRRDIVARLARQGFQARAAVADTVGCAWAVARYGTELRVLSGSRPRDAPAPAAARRAADSAGDGHRPRAGRPQAHRRRIDRPRAPLAARFGEDFLRRLDQAAAAPTSRSRRACRCRLM